MARWVKGVNKLTVKHFMLLVVLVYFASNVNGFPNREIVTKWAQLLDSQLTNTLDRLTGIKNLEKSYDDLRKAQLVPLNGNDLVAKMSSDLTRKLEKKMAALERLVTAAEAVVKNYKYDHTITKVDYVKMKEFVDNDPRLTYSEKFKKGVNFAYSGVHIPVEIYEGYPEILNGLKWSAALDQVFRENLENDPDLMWQYFGSQTGYMRTYPANQWVSSPTKDLPDLYDVRLRPWYVHASSSPKDMLILMDSSGSMHGQTMEIMKIAVKILLTTLGENDFVNVASFNNKAEWVSCLKTFVQANRRNKQALFQGIDDLEDGNMASLSRGLEFAFKEFLKFQNNRTEPWAGADCNQVIMLFSDGGTEEAWDVLKKYNADKKIRVFTYAVGPHPVPYATLKEISCKNRGFFTTIPAMGAIRTKIQDYVKVLGRTLVLSEEKQFQWTNFYLDAMGLGMMNTVTLPVFNRTEGGNQSMVGVMGVDVTLQEMLDYEPSYQIGPTGYSFGLNRNGLVVFHPDLRTKFDYMDDPPHFDFLEVEVESEEKEQKEQKYLFPIVFHPIAVHQISFLPVVIHPIVVDPQWPNAAAIAQNRIVWRTKLHYLVGPPWLHEDFLREKMINLETGHKIIKSLIKMPNGKHVVWHRMEYFYTSLKKTSYTIAIVLPKDRTHVLIVDSMDTMEGLDIDENEVEGIFLAPWKYCHNTVLTSNITEIIRNLSSTIKENPSSCKSTLIQRLLWDVRKTEDIIHFWQTEDRDNKRDGVVATFVQTEGGLTRVFPPRESVHLLEETNPSRSLIYQRAYFGEGYVFLPPKISSGMLDQSGELTTIVKSISFSRGGTTYKPAVVGIVVDSMWLKSYLESIPSRVPHSCSDIDEVLCYLIDDGGFIITSNQPDHVNVSGKFLGYVDSEIMNEMYSEEIYMRIEEFNYEDRCHKSDKVNVNAGYKTPHNPLNAVLSSFNIGWLFDLAAWSQIKYWLYSLFSSIWLPRSEALPEFFELPNVRICNTHKAQYYLGRWGTSKSGELRCNNCTRYYTLAKVGRTNLLLLLSTKPCAPLFCEQVPPLLQAVEEVTGRNICDLPLRYRLRPDKCYSFHHEENNSECGAVATLALPHLALLMELLCLLLMTVLGQNDQDEARVIPIFH